MLISSIAIRRRVESIFNRFSGKGVWVICATERVQRYAGLEAINKFEYIANFWAPPMWNISQMYF